MKTAHSKRSIACAATVGAALFGVLVSRPAQATTSSRFLTSVASGRIPVQAILASLEASEATAS